MTDITGVNDPDFVQSLARGLAVIRVFDADHSALSLSDIAKRADISPAAARRFLRTLEALGYVRSTGRQFSLTPKILELGFSYLSALSLPQITQPHLERLSQKLEESVSCAVLTEDEVVYVARVSPRRIMTVGITIGTRFPAVSTSMGRVLLAALPQPVLTDLLKTWTPVAHTAETITDRAKLAAEIKKVRDQGWCLINSELETGLCSVAVAIRGRDGETLAAINVSTTTSRHTPESVVHDFLPLLQLTAAEIEADLSCL